MKWILVYIMLNNTEVVAVQSLHNSMYDCFDAREQLVETVGKPIINYQAICIAWTGTGDEH